MSSPQEPKLPGNTGDTSISALNWKYALDDSALLEGRMAPAYPQGVNRPLNNLLIPRLDAMTGSKMTAIPEC